MPATVLVIDGKNHLGEIVTKVVEEDGGSCLVAPDLEAADSLIGTVKVDWIALDLGAVEGSAAVWLARLAQTRPDLAGRTLVMMDPPYRRAVAESLEALGASVLMKPLRADRLRIELLPDENAA